MSKKLYEFDSHFFPAKIYFPATEKAYRRLMKNIGVEPVIPDSAGRAERYVIDGKPAIVLIWLSKACESRTAADVLGLIAHECLHAVQMVEKDIGTRFDDETACYLLQKLVMWVNASYAEAGRGFKE